MRLLTVLTILASALTLPSHAAAQCPSYRAFDQVARESPMLVVARVVAVTDESIDVDVAWDVQGNVPAQRIRVWDFFAATSSAGLSKLKPREIVVIAAVRVTAFLTGHGPFNFNAQPTDFAVETCREVFRRFDSEEAARAYVIKTAPEWQPPGSSVPPQPSRLVP